MTIKEALIAELNDLSVNDATLEKILVDHSLISPGEYESAVHKKIIAACLLDVYVKLLANPNISEGGYSESWNNEGLLNAIKHLCSIWGFSNPMTPKLRAVYKG